MARAFIFNTNASSALLMINIKTKNFVANTEGEVLRQEVKCVNLHQKAKTSKMKQEKASGIKTRRLPQIT